MLVLAFQHKGRQVQALGMKERMKQKQFEVFVGGLDKDVNEEESKNVFEKVDEIIEIRLANNPHTQKNNVFTFILFVTIE